MTSNGGNNPTSGLFGGSTPAGSLFGNQTSGALFGTQPTGSLFGNPSGAAPSANPPIPSLFGQSPSPSNPSSFLSSGKAEAPKDSNASMMFDSSKSGGLFASLGAPPVDNKSKALQDAKKLTIPESNSKPVGSLFAPSEAINPSAGLFGGISMFGAKKEQGSAVKKQETGLFGKKDSPQEQGLFGKKEQTNPRNQQSSLFGSKQQTAFGKKDESIFGKPVNGAVFLAKNDVAQAKAVNQKASKFQSIGLFGGNQASKTEKKSQLPSIPATQIQPQVPSPLFGGQPASQVSSLFGPQPTGQTPSLFGPQFTAQPASLFGTKTDQPSLFPKPAQKKPEQATKTLNNKSQTAPTLQKATEPTKFSALEPSSSTQNKPLQTHSDNPAGVTKSEAQSMPFSLADPKTGGLFMQSGNESLPSNADLGVSKANQSSNQKNQQANELFPKQPTSLSFGKITNAPIATPKKDQNQVNKPSVGSSLIQSQFLTKEKSRDPPKAPEMPNKATDLTFSFQKTNSALVTQEKPTPILASIPKQTKQAAPSHPLKDSFGSSKGIATEKGKQVSQGQPTKVTGASAQPKSNSSGPPERLIGNDKRQRTFFQVSKNISASSQGIIDFKTFRDCAANKTLDMLISQSKQKVLKSIKAYFTTAKKPFTRASTSYPTDRQRFLEDFSTTLMKILGLAQDSFELLLHFVQRVMSEQNYQQKLFKPEGWLNQEYFKANAIYCVGLTGEMTLNQQGSSELRLLLQKFVNKWFIQKIDLLNLMAKYPAVFRPPSDLFAHILLNLLQMSSPEGQDNFSLLVKDYNRLLLKKATQVLELQRQQLVNYSPLLPDQYFQTFINLLQRSQPQEVVSLSLRILLPTLKFKNAADIKSNSVQLLSKTKSLPLLPLRVLIACKKNRSWQFFPSGSDLYHYVRGDEWAQWLDEYIGGQQNSDQPALILQSLLSLSPSVLLQRLVAGQKGIYSFFEMLREQNMQALYYRLLQRCISTEQSAVQINQFYFKKTSLSIQFQEIVQMVTTFSQNIQVTSDKLRGLPQQSVLQAKISLLVRMLEIQPQRIQQIEALIFSSSRKYKKKFEGQTRRQGHKIMHLLIDIINIVSIRSLQSKILGKIFKLFASLLRNRKTQPIVLATIAINKPSFAFLERPLAFNTLDAINQMLDVLLTGNYLYELTLGYDAFTQDEIRSQRFYLFRYQDSQFSRQVQLNTHLGYRTHTHFSIYWANQLLGILKKQKFNPYLICKLLEKLNIRPPSELPQPLPKYQEKIPPIFQSIVNNLNSQNIWDSIRQILDFKIGKRDGKYALINKCSAAQDTPQAHKLIYHTLKLIKTILQLNHLYTQNSSDASWHFSLRSLEAVQMVSRVRLNSLFNSNSSRHFLILSIMANIQTNQPFYSDSQIAFPWQAEQVYYKTDYGKLLSWVGKQGGSLDLQQAQNFMKVPVSSFYDSHHNSTTLSLQILISLLKQYQDCSIEGCLSQFLPVAQNERVRLKDDVITHLTEVLLGYSRDQQRPLASISVMKFIFDLRYSTNQLNTSLSNKLFNSFSTIYQTRVDSRLDHLLVDYLTKQSKENQTNALSEKTLLRVLSTFVLRRFYLDQGREIKDANELSELVRVYSTQHYPLANLNQLQRMMDERCLIEIGYQFQDLTKILNLMLNSVLAKNVNSNIVACINQLVRLIAFSNLAHLHQDLPGNRDQSIRPVSSIPRLYIQDPNLAFFNQSYSNYQDDLEPLLLKIQEKQKNNVVQWLYQKSLNFSQRVSLFLQILLTLDQNLYRNTHMPIAPKRPDLARVDLFSHLLLGDYSLSAIEAFGRSEEEACQVVATLGENMLNKLINRGEIQLLANEQMRILFMSIQWLHSQQRKGRYLFELTTKIANNYNAFLPPEGKLIQPEALNIFIVFAAITGKSLTRQGQRDLRQHLVSVLRQYNRLSRKDDMDARLTLAAQLVYDLLMLNPLYQNDMPLLDLLVLIWTRETRHEFFYNQSALIVIACEKDGRIAQQISRKRPLSNCYLLGKVGNELQRYSGNERNWEAIVWTWGIKVANALCTQSSSLLCFNQISQFAIKFKDNIVSIISFTQGKLTKAYLQNLQRLLQMLITLFSQELWIAFNRNLLQELTHTLSHKLVKMFVSFAQGAHKFQHQTSNQQALSQVRPEGNFYDTLTNSLDNHPSDNIFQYQLRLRVNSCLKKYCFLMSRAFRVSHYVENLFGNNVSSEFKYTNVFWDSFSKNLICLCKYSLKQIKHWSQLPKLQSNLQLIRFCCEAPTTFVQNGYLNAAHQLPTDQTTLSQDLNQLTYCLAELGTVHYLKERVYLKKYGSMLVSQLHNFGKNIRQFIDNAIPYVQKTETKMSEISSKQFELFKSLTRQQI